MVCILFASMITVVSCHGNDEISNNDQVGSSSKKISSLSKTSEPENIKVEYGSKMFEAGNDRFVGYSNDGLFLYDVVLADSEMRIEDNLDSTGEAIITNPKTNEQIIVYNVKETQTETIFDVKTSAGHIFKGMSAYTGDSATGKFPVAPLIRAFVAVATAVGVLVASNQSQSSCQTALGNLHCPKGSSPYMTYESGWFSSSCQIGCH